MPPRVPVHSLHAGAEAASALACSSRAGTASTVRAFSSTPSCQRSTLLRRKMRDWFKTEGRQYKRHTPGAGPQYLGNGAKVFPNNPAFGSQPVLSEEARELIWEKIMRQGESIKAVSAELSVDMRRVAAVVRLKEVEKDWISKVSLLRVFPRIFHTPPPPYSPMMITIHSISLEDMQHMVTHLALRASLRRVLFIYC